MQWFFKGVISGGRGRRKQARSGEGTNQGGVPPSLVPARFHRELESVDHVIGLVPPWGQGSALRRCFWVSPWLWAKPPTPGTGGGASGPSISGVVSSSREHTGGKEQLWVYPANTPSRGRKEASAQQKTLWWSPRTSATGGTGVREGEKESEQVSANDDPNKQKSYCFSQQPEGHWKSSKPLPVRNSAECSQVSAFLRIYASTRFDAGV